MAEYRIIPNPHAYSEIVVGKEHRFRIVNEWAKWPDTVKGCSVICCACDADDNLYVSLREHDCGVVVFDKDGNFIREFGRNVFEFAHGIFVRDCGTVLIADGNHHVIREYTPEGEFVRNYGKENEPSDTGYVSAIGIDSIVRVGGPFNKPTKMVEASDGTFFASDGYRNAAVHRLDADGNCLATWGGPGREVGQYRIPHSVMVDSRDRVWVTDRENGRIIILAFDGTILAVLEDLARPGETWEYEGEVYVNELDRGITIYDLDLNVTEQIDLCGLGLSPHGATQAGITLHGMNGNSKGDLFICTLKSEDNRGIIKLERIR